MNDVNQMLVDMIVDLIDNEPPSDAGQHPSTAVHERVGAEWAEWHKCLSGARALLGHRLVAAAIREEESFRQGAGEPEEKR